jgi:membrane-bound lytic murein transglycosylase E
MPLTLFVVIRSDAFTKEGLRVKLRWFAFLIVLLAGVVRNMDYVTGLEPGSPGKRAMQWMPSVKKRGGVGRQSASDCDDCG